SGEQAVLLRRQCLCLLDDPAPDLAEAAFRLRAREGEIAHEAFDHPGAGAVLLGERDATRGCKPAILHLAAVDVDGRRILRVTLPETRNRGRPEADQRLASVIRVALEIAAQTAGPCRSRKRIVGLSEMIEA